MRVSKEEASTINRALDHWRETEMISQEESRQLLASFQVVAFDWKRLAEYSFWLAIACILISVAAALADDWLIELFTKIFNAPDIIKCLFFAGLAAGLYAFGLYRRARFPQKVYSNEAVFFLGVAATAIAIGFIGKLTDTVYGHFTSLLLLAAVVYGALGLGLRSNLIWLCSLISFSGWFGAETGYLSDWDAYYLGMNYPLRFMLLGLVLIVAGEILFRLWHSRHELLKPTRAVGLSCTLTALWILSIYGNSSDIQSWSELRQIEFIHWSLLLAIASATSLLHGIRYDDAMTRGFGLTFMLINLYTLFFAYLWDGVHKALFFALLAVSFWYLGSRAERIWHLGLGKPSPKQTSTGDNSEYAG